MIVENITFKDNSSLESNLLLTRTMDKGLELDRSEIWKGGWNAFADSYYLGVGMGQFLHLSGEYADVDINQRKGLTLHSDYVSLLCENGPLAVTLFVIALFSIRLQLLQSFLKTTVTFQKKTRFVFAAFLVLLIFSVTNITTQGLLFWSTITMIVTFLKFNPSHINKIQKKVLPTKRKFFPPAPGSPFRSGADPTATFNS